MPGVFGVAERVKSLKHFDIVRSYSILLYGFDQQRLIWYVFHLLDMVFS